jgi:hypothetical protein
VIELCLAVALWLPALGSHCEDVVEVGVATSPTQDMPQNSSETAARGEQEETSEEVAALQSRDLERWHLLAECESGNWIDGGASFEAGSARWYWGRPGTEVPPWGTTIHHGGLQFHPDTWSWVAPMVGLGHIAYAYDAPIEGQILAAEKVLELQGWRAWPVCSKKLGFR